MQFFGDKINIIDSKSSAESVMQEIALSGNQHEAFYVCDVGDIVRKYEMWKTAMPRVEPHYAVKCNNNKFILETLVALGIGFDCASKNEISQILNLGAKPQRIIYANPVKALEHIEYAASVGVSMTVFDSEMELCKIKDLNPEAELLIRIKYDDEDAGYKFGKKFGCDPDTEASELLRTARCFQLNVIGVSFHIGCCSKTPSTYYKAIAACRRVFDSASMIGYDLRLVDIGGGFPGEHGTNLDEIAMNVNSALEKYFPDESIRIISEPGKFFANSAYTLISRVNVAKLVNEVDPISHEEKTTQVVYANTSVYGTIIGAIFTDIYYAKPLLLKPESELYTTTVWGCTCCACDKLSENDPLPEMELGDWIFYQDAGAYTLSLASQFNGYRVPKVHAIINEDTWCKLKNLYKNPEDVFMKSNQKS